MPAGHTPPGPRGLGILRLRRMRRDPLAFFAMLPRRYGPLTALRFGPVRLLAVADPKLVTRVLVDDASGYKKGMALERARLILGDGLLTSEGELHRSQLIRIGPALAPRRVATYADAIRAHAEDADATWRDGGVVDVAGEMARLTLRIVAATLFGSRLEPSDLDRVVRSLTAVMEHFDWFITHPLGQARVRIPTPRVRRLLGARAELREVVDGLIASRRESGGDDLLSQLVAAGGMSDRQLRDEALTLMLAGHETTANWLTFTWLALADHPAVAQRMREELDAVLGTRVVSPADRDRLPYTGAVLEEALRLWPPAWGVGRRARTERELGDAAVQPGTVVSVCPFVMHRRPGLWDDPERFDPERWRDGRAATVPRGGFIPFSDGPRRCVGEHFARAEALVIVATLARRWELHRVSDEPIALDPKVTLRPRGPVPMRLVARAAV